ESDGLPGPVEDRVLPVDNGLRAFVHDAAGQLGAPWGHEAALGRQRPIAVLDAYVGAAVAGRRSGLEAAERDRLRRRQEARGVGARDRREAELLRRGRARAEDGEEEERRRASVAEHEPRAAA